MPDALTKYPPTSDLSSGKQLELTILMPCLNEAETLEGCVNIAVRALEQDGIDGEVLIADNGSTDGSQDIAIRCGARVVNVDAKGYGAALHAGIVAARGRYVIMGDSDGSYDFSRVGDFLTELRNGHDLVMGNRFRGGIARNAMPPLHRYLGNPVLTTIGRILFRSPCGDFHCGLRGVRKDAILALALRTTGMEFASEMVVKATIHRLKITEVPTTLSPDGRSRAPHLRSWRDGWRHLRFLLMYSPRYLFLAPGFLLVSAGLTVGGLLIRGPKHIGSMRFDVNTLLFASGGVILGVQLMLFWLFASVFAMTEGFLPPDERLEVLFEYINLETGLVLSATVLALGLGLSLASVGSWQSTGFGALSPERSLRLVIPAVMLMILGVQGIFASFFFSILGLKRS